MRVDRSRHNGLSTRLVLTVPRQNKRSERGNTLLSAVSLSFLWSTIDRSDACMRMMRESTAIASFFRASTKSARHAHGLVHVVRGSPRVTSRHETFPLPTGTKYGSTQLLLSPTTHSNGVATVRKTIYSRVLVRFDTIRFDLSSWIDVRWISVCVWAWWMQPRRWDFLLVSARHDVPHWISRVVRTFVPRGRHCSCHRSCR
mmetsp:Transcript_15007/g.32147  ORF Transcript_15007/g.32147 Transcript_15007/m.32147 type:complete len:201 (-) Transcript_15007:2088-2690(-)